MTEALVFVDIFVGQIDAAGKRGLAVDDQKLAVVAVIEAGGKDRDIGVERVGADAHLAQLFRVAHGKPRDAAEIIVYDAHVDACRRLLAQKLQHGVPHLAGGDDEKLDENIALRLFDLLQHRSVAAFAARKILRVRVVVDGVAGGREQIARVVERGRFSGGQLP